MTNYLITANELRTRQAQQSPVVVCDCRARLGDLAWGRAQWRAGHLPGAQHLDLDRDLAAAPGDQAGGGGRHPLPDPDRLAHRLGALGASNDALIVLYDDVGGAMAARAWWCLRWLGHDNIALLDGGLQAWTAIAPESLESGEPEPCAASFERRPALTRQIDVTELQANVDALALTDARSQARYDGREEPIDPVAGHIPGAVCLPFNDNLNADGTFRSPDELAARFAGLPDPVVCYCGSGVTAAHNLLALRLAGREEGILYPGSWSGWIEVPARPIATADR